MPKDSKVKKEKKHFWKDFKAELKKVIWPTSKQLVNNTVAVITIVIIVAAIVFVLDFAFGEISTFGNNKVKDIKEKIESSNSIEDVNEETPENQEVVEDNVQEDVEQEDEEPQDSESEAEPEE